MSANSKGVQREIKADMQNFVRQQTVPKGCRVRSDSAVSLVTVRENAAGENNMPI